MLFRNDLMLTFHSPPLLKPGVYHWCDLEEEGKIITVLVLLLATTWWLVYKGRA